MGLRKNFIYNIIVTTSNYLFPFIVFPYVSRTLGVHNLGICNFVDNVVLYFTMFSMMGMGILGIREIAAVQGNPIRTNQTFLSLFCLNGIFTMLSIISFLICIAFIPQFHQYQELMYIGCLNIAANFLLIDWLYKGLEDFKYITKRTLTIKIIYVFAIFLFVRQKDDYIIYYALTTISVILNALINILHSRKFISFKSLTLSISQYKKPYFKLGLYWISTTIYASFYTIILGFVSTPDEIGYFTTASKLIILTMSLYTAWTTVAMPRSSAMLSNGETLNFLELINKSFNALFAFSIPIVIIGIFFSHDIIFILSGNGYEGASIPSAILMPLIFIIGCSQIAVIQILMPKRCDTILLTNSIIGAIVGLFLCYILVPRFFAIGASISWLMSETIVLILAMMFVQKNFNIHFPWKLYLTNLTGQIPTIILCLILFRGLTSFSPFSRLLIVCVSVFTYTLFLQYRIIKNPLIINIFTYTTSCLYNILKK